MDNPKGVENAIVLFTKYYIYASRCKKDRI